MGKELIFLIVLMVGMPLLALELPILLKALPRWLLKILCFLPLGGILFLGLAALHQGNITAFVLSIPMNLLALYGGFTLKSLID